MSTRLQGPSPKAVGGSPGVEDARADDHHGSSSSSNGEQGVLLDSANSLERWNDPRVNIARFGNACLALFMMGLGDGSIGALLPYIGTYYGVDYATVSTIFIVPVVGYIIGALTNKWIHETFGQRGVAFVGPFCRLVAYIPLVFHPPFPLLPVLLSIASSGTGIEDGAYNVWVGNLEQANELLGLMHGSYGFGAMVGPLVATAMVTKANLPWYCYYYVMIFTNTVELIFGVTAFWEATGAVHRERLAKDGAGKEATPLSTVLKSITTWLIAIFLLGYVGVEVSLGGWIPTFMIEVRHVSGFLAGLTATMFWLGLTIGRVVLGFVTGRLGARLAIFAYLVLCVTSVISYWLIPNFVVSIISVIFMGFFMGPLFPASIFVATQLLPPEHHISAIGFAAAIGSGGAAILPFVVGAIAQSQGVGVLQPIAIIMLAFITLIWLGLPSGPKEGGSEDESDEQDEAEAEFSFTGLINRLIDSMRWERRGAIRLEDGA